MSDIERKLATVRTIDQIRPIEGADAIETAIVDGWQVVIRKGEFTVGQKAIYLEIDSWVPYELAPFLCKGKEPREFNGIKGERLRTVKLRGQVSQGLLLPADSGHFIGDDLTEVLGIQKWEKPIPAQLAGTVKGSFPSFLIKTDQERVQNLARELPSFTGLYEITEKLDGSSMTVYYRNAEEYGVCSRNLDLKEDPNNAFWKRVIDDNIIGLIRDSGITDIALQGELIGEGIQGNPYKLKGTRFYVFDVFLIDEYRYALPEERMKILTSIGYTLHVPVIEVHGVPDNVDDVLAMSEFKSFVNRDTEAEGIVWKSMDSQNSFKSISNRFLLKEKE